MNLSTHPLVARPHSRASVAGVATLAIGAVLAVASQACTTSTIIPVKHGAYVDSRDETAERSARLDRHTSAR